MLKVVQDHKETLDRDNPRDLIDIYLLEMEKDTVGEFTQDNLIMNVTDLFAAGILTSGTSYYTVWSVSFVMLRRVWNYLHYHEVGPPLPSKKHTGASF